MPHLGHSYTQLPRKLQEELSLSTKVPVGARKPSNKVTSRKEVRREVKATQRAKQTPQNWPPHKYEVGHDNGRLAASPLQSTKKGDAGKHESGHTKQLSRSLKNSESRPTSETRTPVTLKAKTHLKIVARDDEEIEHLEKLLKIKGKPKLPKSFQDDGLDTLLDGLEDRGDSASQELRSKRKADDEQWIQNKRQRKLEGVEDDAHNGVIRGTRDLEDSGEFSTDEKVDEWEPVQSETESASSDSEDVSEPPAKALRENPFIAPRPAAGASKVIKYVPPSLRKKDDISLEDNTRLQKQLQGFLNRLSESNLPSIVLEVEKLYRDQPRHSVTSCLVNILKATLSDSASLQDTYIILHAGFIAGLYKTVGIDFAAQIVESLHGEFVKIYNANVSSKHELNEVVDKRLTNLIQLIAELYNLSVIACNLIYDFIRLLLGTFSDLNTELLMKLLRACGAQIRQDDPASFKEISLRLQSKVGEVGEAAVSARTKFTIDMIENLKKNRGKSTVLGSSIASEHRVAMKKTLGNLEKRNLGASEPLRFGFDDLSAVDKRGKWWLIGASFKDAEKQSAAPPSHGTTEPEPRDELDLADDVTGDLLQLAKDQRMNTDVRRSIFIATMSSTDYSDAYLRLKKLRLKKTQELEIPKVLLHCASVEQVYNPFYTLIARRFCADHRIRMAFQFALWDVFKRTNEGEDSASEDDIDERESQVNKKVDLRFLVNLGKMYGNLIADEGLSLSILKNLNLAYLPPKTQTLVEILLTTVIVQSQRRASDGYKEKEEGPLVKIFSRPKEMPDMAAGLQYFLKKVVRKGDAVATKQEKGLVRWGCDVLIDRLKGMTS